MSLRAPPKKIIKIDIDIYSANYHGLLQVLIWYRNFFPAPILVTFISGFNAWKWETSCNKWIKMCAVGYKTSFSAENSILR